MGAGHNATARALEQSAQRLWPAATTRWVDALAVMGPGVGPVFRQIYVTNVQTTPWLYEFFYDSLWRHRWFASASKRFVGAWCGRRLAPVIEEYSPDLIVSTYPLGSAGLQWLREHRGLDTVLAAWISDFSPHPFWVYPHLDVHFVMHDACVHPAGQAVPSASVQVAAPPVSDAFGLADRSVARDKLGLDRDAFVALLSCGYFGFGTVEKAVDTLLAAHPGVQVVAVCGHNERLRQRVAARRAGPGRLFALGWTDDMAAYMAAADVVVTNAGGATSLEAMACGRAVLMFEPIAAHGRANAELMARAGLALLCRTPAELHSAVRRLVEHPQVPASMEEAALRHAESRTREDDLRRAVARVGQQRTAYGHPPVLRAMQPEDAFFLYADTPRVNQALGGVVYLEDRVDLETVRAGVGERLERLPNLRRRIVGSASGWRRPAWLFEDRIDVREHVTERVLGAPGEPTTFAEIVDDFFATPLDLRRPPWHVCVVQGLGGGRSAFVVKLHHALGDGFAAIDAMAGLLDEVPDTGSGDPPASPPVSGQSATREAAGTRAASAWHRYRLVRQRSGRVASGLWGLSRLGTAPRSRLNGRVQTGEQRHALLSLPVPDVRATARGLRTRTNALLLTVFADGVHRLLEERGERVGGTSLRVMVPRTIRTPENRHALGNITAAVPLDLPLSAAPPRKRLAEIEARMQRSLDSGQPEASRLLVKSMGALPAPVHARLARGAYNARWFNAIVSVIPGPHRQQSFAGVRLAEVYPVLPVAEGVGLAVGLMRWADAFAVGFTGDVGLMGDVDRLAEHVRDAFVEFRDAAGE